MRLDPSFTSNLAETQGLDQGNRSVGLVSTGLLLDVQKTSDLLCRRILSPSSNEPLTWRKAS